MRFRLPLVLLIQLCAGVFASVAGAHPLDPLTRAEIDAAVGLVRKHERFVPGSLFPTVVLDEPPKVEVLLWRPGQPALRRAHLVVYDRTRNATFDARVDLLANKVLQFARVAGVQPHVFKEEYESVPKIIKNDLRWQTAMRKRGLTDFSKIKIDTWAMGPLPPPRNVASPSAAMPRLLRGISFWAGTGTNAYDRPIEGVTALVDVNQRKVVDLIDTGVVPISTEHDELDELSQNASAAPRLAPLLSTQPRGASFTVDGHEVKWGHWSFRFAMHPREGLVLYDVAYEDHGARRPILYRGALAEMVVPYGEPEQAWAWRNAFDEGEYGLGRLASPLEPGLDAPLNAQLFDAELADDTGKVYTAKQTIGLYERDGGILWKHYNDDLQVNETRRARELVLFFVATIGNYDYAVQWIFHLDGEIEVECALSGIMLAKGVARVAPQVNLPAATGTSLAGGATTSTSPSGASPTGASSTSGSPSGASSTGAPPTGPSPTNGTTPPATAAIASPAAVHAEGHGSAHRVAPSVAAPHHQHFFSFRIDLDVDGPANSVYELQTHSSTMGPGNPYGNQIVMEETRLASESGAQRELNLASARAWRFGNDSRVNALGGNPSYALAPGGNTVPFASADSPIRQRARFLDHHVWVTRYVDSERYAAGWYPNQGISGEGLPQYVANDEPLAQQDLVLWYTMGLTHIPRPEEWPIMSAHKVGFRLVPVGFFTKNPALELPRVPN